MIVGGNLAVHDKAVDGRSISFAEAAWFIMLPEGGAAH
jgi:hypothetical protein